MVDDTVANAEVLAPKPDPAPPSETAPKEIGGPKGPEPTRFGDWERNGRCIDF
ncbi:MAG TPA: DUF1674 domain-containing protein [Acidiphilium sp.]|nr:MAG: DUF1674 domain-containing protein [Acidiphilium sp. 21-60-14]OYV91259.1 MAG: DUF1674 domain-containing protein [Acidiphilium sp. 37-60-79]OZB39892.1 MAG: DUF1674 domain-containing protein [Acidiphilium sp. 34-60-192]HQT87103.1 DUF1674 domain-containing protein [Acidiphilium sp.]HQU24524.1 DUF1674 domain-containing protein [Acidiphilium sp.]